MGIRGVITAIAREMSRFIVMVASEGVNISIVLLFTLN